MTYVQRDKIHFDIEAALKDLQSGKAMSGGAKLPKSIFRKNS